MNNKQIEKKSFNIADYAKEKKQGGGSSKYSGYSFSSFGIENMRSLLNKNRDDKKAITIDGKQYTIKNELVEKLLENMKNVKNWTLVNNLVKCTTQKTLELNNGESVLQTKIWICDILDGTKSDIYTKYTLKQNGTSGDLAKKLIADYADADKSKIDALNKKLQNSKIDDLKKCCIINNEVIKKL